MDRRSADALAAWLEVHHPDIYSQLLVHASSSGIGLSGLGDDFALEDFTPDLSNINIDVNSSDFDLSDSVVSAINDGWADSIADAALQPIGAPAAQVNLDTGTSSGGGILSAIGRVGSYIASPEGIKTLGGIAAAGIAVAGAVAVSQAQSQILQAQVQRAQAGLPPAPISYDQNGTPVYTGGTSSIPPDLAAAIANGTAHPVVLSDGSIGYTIDSPGTLNSVLNFSSIPWYVWLSAAGLLLILVSQQ